MFAHLLNRKFEDGMQPQPTDTLIVHARFTVTNPTPEPRLGHLWLHFGDTSRVNYGYKRVKVTRKWVRSSITALRRRWEF